MTTSTEHDLDITLFRRICEAIHIDWPATMAELKGGESDLYGLADLIDDVQEHIASELAELHRAVKQEAELRDPSIQYAAALAVIDKFIAEGKLIRLEGGSIIEAERFDPAIHVPAAAADARRERGGAA